jgi:hypothetical protein
MAWFENHYKCSRCGLRWTDEWSCTCDDDCPHCGARHMSPYGSEDLSVIIRRVGTEFAVLESPNTAEDSPSYRELGRFGSEVQAAKFIEVGDY